MPTSGDAGSLPAPDGEPMVEFPHRGRVFSPLIGRT